LIPPVLIFPHLSQVFSPFFRTTPPNNGCLFPVFPFSGIPHPLFFCYFSRVSPVTIPFVSSNQLCPKVPLLKYAFTVIKFPTVNRFFIKTGDFFMIFQALLSWPTAGALFPHFRLLDISFRWTFFLGFGLVSAVLPVFHYFPSQNSPDCLSLLFFPLISPYGLRLSGFHW